MNEEVLAAITEGFTSMGGMVTQVVVVGVAGIIAAMGVKRGALFAINWLKGVFNHS